MNLKSQRNFNSLPLSLSIILLMPDYTAWRTTLDADAVILYKLNITLSSRMDAILR